MKAFAIITISFLIFISCYSQTRNEISQIKFHAGRCFGPCPVFEMTINSDRSASYRAIEFNNIEGLFNARISQQQFDSLLLLISGADLFLLENGYHRSSTDHPTYTLTLTLQNGQAKSIRDYGPAGPEKLRMVYEKIFALRESEDWK